MINYYEKIKGQKHAYNPNFEQHKMKIPMRLSVCGSSGSGKTNSIINLLKLFNGTFDTIEIYTKQTDEPLYKYLLDVYKKTHKIGEDEALTIDDDITKLKKINDYDETKNHLIIIDDFINDITKTMSELFIRGRKKNISIIFIVQSYYINNNEWKLIRRNLNYIIIKKINSSKELMAIIKDYSLDISKEKFLKMYEDITRDNKFNFLMLDLDNEPEKRFRKNFNEVIDINKLK